MTTSIKNSISSPITFTELASGTYTLTVTATNAIGQSLPSIPSNTVIVTAAPNKVRTWKAGYCGGDNSQAGHAAYNSNHRITIGAYGTWDDNYSSWSAAEGSYLSSGFLIPERLLPADDDHITIIAPGLILNTGITQNIAALTAAGNGSDSAFTAGWAQIASNLLSGGWNSPSTVLRIGHEMNGNWEPWGTGGQSTSNAQAFASAFRAAVTAVRAKCPLIRYDLSFSAGYYSNSTTIADTYPGDAYVDILSIDYYDGFSTGSVVTGASDFASAQSILSMNTVSAFAHSHNKLFAVDEWGLNGSLTGHDNPVFVQQMFNSLVSINNTYSGIVSHDCFFDLSAGGAGPWSANPNAAALYQSLWSS